MSRYYLQETHKNLKTVNQQKTKHKFHNETETVSDFRAAAGVKRETGEQDIYLEQVREESRAAERG